MNPPCNHLATHTASRPLILTQPAVIRLPTGGHHAERARADNPGRACDQAQDSRRHSPQLRGYGGRTNAAGGCHVISCGLLLVVVLFSCLSTAATHQSVSDNPFLAPSLSPPFASPFTDSCLILTIPVTASYLPSTFYFLNDPWPDFPCPVSPYFSPTLPQPATCAFLAVSCGVLHPGRAPA